MSERRKVLEFFEDPNSYWKQKAEERIESIRKGNAELKVVDKDGNPVKDAKISVKQKKHEFSFGANCFMIDELETEEKNEIYKEKFAELFNMATLPFYWADLEPEKGVTRYKADSPKIYRRPAPDLCLEYCKENGIEPREHALAYELQFPKWLKGASADVVKPELERRYKEISELYKDKIRTIEVTNEMLWENNITDFYWDEDYVEWCFKLARKYFPDNQLAINEYQSALRDDDRYYNYIKKALEAGAPIDAIGIQYHMFHHSSLEYDRTRLYYNPDHLLNRLDMHAEFGKPLQITEITVPAYSNDPEDEEIQAILIEYLYTLWFSHPAIEQIIYWNLVDGYAAFVEQGDMTGGENVYYGGLLRFDMSEKPAFKMLNNLLNKKWHTEEQTSTDADGKADFKGFYGDYDITVTVDGKEYTKEISLSSKKDNEFVLAV